MGKSACSEELSTFGGVYSGAVSHQSITDLVDQSDLVILIGGIRSDFNSGSFSYSFGVTQTIELHSDHALIQFGRFEIGFHTLLPALIKNLDKKELASVDNHNLNAARAEGKKVPAGEENEMVTQAAFWPLIGSFLRPNVSNLSILFVDTDLNLLGYYCYRNWNFLFWISTSFITFWIDYGISSALGIDWMVSWSAIGISSRSSRIWNRSKSAFIRRRWINSTHCY